ncbi:MAG: hypothetical protein ACI81R_002099 [Bradymonadia bacterium]
MVNPDEKTAPEDDAHGPDTDGLAVGEDLSVEPSRELVAVQNVPKRKGIHPFWLAVGRGATSFGVATARGAKWTAALAAEAYKAVDPDVRRHAFHAPLVGMTHLTGAPKPISGLPDDGHPPVICVHGLVGHPGNFAGLRGYLRIMGRSRTYAIPQPAGRRIPELGADVSDAIRKVFEVNDLDDDAQVDVVAHSRGGLATRYALLDPDIARRVRRLITLGTPHQGTLAARYGGNDQTLDLRPDSEVLRGIEEQIPWPAPPFPELTTLGSDADMLLLPATTCTVPGATHVDLPGLTHLSFLLHPRAFHRVWNALDADAPCP